jgi:hypothetical protein
MTDVAAHRNQDIVCVYAMHARQTCRLLTRTVHVPAAHRAADMVHMTRLLTDSGGGGRGGRRVHYLVELPGVTLAVSLTCNRRRVPTVDGVVHRDAQPCTLAYNPFIMAFLLLYARCSPPVYTDDSGDGGNEGNGGGSNERNGYGNDDGGNEGTAAGGGGNGAGGGGGGDATVASGHIAWQNRTTASGRGGALRLALACPLAAIMPVRGNALIWRPDGRSLSASKLRALLESSLYRPRTHMQFHRVAHDVHRATHAPYWYIRPGNSRTLYRGSCVDNGNLTAWSMFSSRTDAAHADPRHVQLAAAGVYATYHHLQHTMRASLTMVRSHYGCAHRIVVASPARGAAAADAPPPPITWYLVTADIEPAYAHLVSGRNRGAESMLAVGGTRDRSAASMLAVDDSSAVAGAANVYGAALLVPVLHAPCTVAVIEAAAHAMVAAAFPRIHMRPAVRTHRRRK